MSEYHRFDEVPWDRWSPDQVATLVFVIREGSVLLIRKKRGLGAGKINAPGGQIEPGETLEECASREIEEEVGVRPGPLVWCGEHAYQFTDGLGLHVTVFRTDTFAGDVIETEEAAPFWVSVDEIPYDQMWADDRFWVPMMLAGARFRGRWLFDGDDIVEYRLEEVRGQL